jgi:hypothetical protein
MPFRFGTVAALVLLLGACDEHGSTVQRIAATVTPATRLYVLTNAGLGYFSEPLGPASTATSVAIPSSTSQIPASLVVDSQGDVIVYSLLASPQQGQSVISGAVLTGYTRPTPATSPFFTINSQQFEGEGAPGALAFDSKGNLYVASGYGVSVLSPPFSSTSNVTGLQQGIINSSICFDAKNNLYVNFFGAELIPMSVVAPPYTSGAASLSTDLGESVCAAYANQLVIIGSTGAIYSPPLATPAPIRTYHGVLVFSLPLSALPIPTATITVPKAYSLVFDGAGNLYVSTGTAIDVFSPPFTDASIPQYVIPMPLGAYGMAFGA